MAVALRSPVPAASLVVGPLLSHWQRAYAHAPRIITLESPRTGNFARWLTAGPLFLVELFIDDGGDDLGFLKSERPRERDQDVGRILLALTPPDLLRGTHRSPGANRYA